MTEKTLPRRRFLRLIGLTLGACALTCAGSSLLLSVEDRPRNPLPVGFPDVTYGDDLAAKKTLVAYASAAGSTGGVADAVGKALVFASGGLPQAAVDVRPVHLVTDLDPYRAVVVGSAIHGGKWLHEATQFVLTHQERLRQMPTAFFLVGMVSASSSATNRNMVAQYLEAERAMVDPLAEGRFVGALHPNQYPFFTGLGMRFFLAYCGVGLRGGDYRDLDAIQAWAKSVRPIMMRS